MDKQVGLSIALYLSHIATNVALNPYIKMQSLIPMTTALCPTYSHHNERNTRRAALREMVRAQQFALALTLVRGRNPDSPEGLSKVTPTR